MGDATVPVVGHIKIILLADGKCQVGGTVPSIFALKGMLGTAEHVFLEQLRQAGERPKIAAAPPGLDFNKIRNGGF